MADLSPSQAVESRCGEQRHVRLPCFQLSQPGGDIAAEGDDGKVGPMVEHLRCPARSTGTDPGARSNVGDAGCADQHVATVRTWQQCGDNQAIWPQGLDILHRVDRSIDPPFGEPGVEFLRPQRLAPDVCQRPVLDTITAGDYGDQFDISLDPAMRLAQAPARFLGLRHGKR